MTQTQYEAVMTGNSKGLSPTPSYFGGNPHRPVEQVSWDDIQVFLTRLNAQQAGILPNGWAYVLPTGASGNMPAGRVPLHLIHGDIQSVLRMQIPWTVE